MTSPTSPTLELDLDAEARLVAGAESPSEVFRALQQAAVRMAPRSAMFLIRKGRIRGWSSTGYSHETTQAQRAMDQAVDPSLLQCFDPAGRTHGSPLEFGQPLADESVAFAVRLRDKPIALLHAERSGSQEPWHPMMLGVLLTVAQLRLELDLVQRKLGAVATKAARPAVAAPNAPPPAARPDSQAATTVANPVAAPTRTGEIAPAPPGDEAPELEAARRYARLVATDIRLYNEEAVMLGRRNGDLQQRLGEQLGRGKDTFLRRHGDLGSTGLSLLHDEYVRVLAGGDANLIPSDQP